MERLTATDIKTINNAFLLRNKIEKALTLYIKVHEDAGTFPLFSATQVSDIKIDGDRLVIFYQWTDEDEAFSKSCSTVLDLEDFYDTVDNFEELIKKAAELKLASSKAYDLRKYKEALMVTDSTPAPCDSCAETCSITNEICDECSCNYNSNYREKQ